MARHFALSILCLLALSLGTSKVSAQGWVSQTSGTTNTLYSVFFTDANTGTAVGAAGTIRRTTNGGTTWTVQTSGVTNFLFAVHFTDANNGIITGTTGLILRTTNGGTTWSSGQSGTTQNLIGISFSDANNGTIVGNSGTILRTTNGGTNWTPQTSGTTQPLFAVSFTDASNGLAVGGDAMFTSPILRTTNGGATWTPQASGTTLQLLGVSMTDANTGTIVGIGGTILRTTNGGANWNTQTSGTAQGLYGVKMIDANIGTIVGGGGTIRRTTNGGANWTNQNTGTTTLYSVSFTDANNGTAVGDNGTILHTSTGGGAPAGPVITSFTPASGVAGADVIINGTGFSGSPQGTVVRFGSAQATVSNVTTTTITAQAPPNATYGPITVTTANKNASSRNPFFVTFGGGGFGGTSWDANVPLGMTSNCQSVAFADLDGDTRLDIILPQNTGSAVRVARNASTGTGNFTFSSSTDIITNWIGPRGVATADFDGDGKLDIVTACTGAASPGRVCILRNLSTSGTISIAPGVLFRDTTDFLYIPYDVAVGDFDGDGRTDIATASQLGSAFFMHTFRNVSSAGSITTSSFEHPTKLAAGNNARRIRTADIDGDGKLDVLVLTADIVGNAVYVYRNTTTGSTISFAPPISLPIIGGTVDFSLGDLNADGKPDLLVLNNEVAAATFGVQQNNSTSGTVAFGSIVSVTMPAPEFQCAIGDVDGDARPDILVVSSGRMYGFRNLNTGGAITSQSFDTRVTIGAIATTTSSWFAAADLDRDSKPEIVVAGYGAGPTNVVVLRNRISTGFTGTPISTGTTADLTGVSFISQTGGCIAGRGGVVRVTTDGGATWSGSNTGTTSDLTGIRLIGSRGFITGAGGLICVSTNNGGTWTPFSTGTGETFNGSSFTSETAGWAVGTGGTICRYNGSTWTSQPTGTAIEFKSVFAIGSTGWAVGANGTICRYNGTSWVPQPTGTSITFNDVAFADENTGFAVGLNSTICKTTNGGTTWTALNTGYSGLSIRSIKLGGANLAWATADGGVVLQSSDGGATWTASYLGSASLKAIEFVQGKGIIVGDGGTGYSFQTTLVSVRETPNSGLPTSFRLEQNYPNPFNPSTTIRFQTTEYGFATLKVYDVLGSEVATLVNEPLNAGEYETAFNASNYSSGIYFYRLQAGSSIQVKKMVLMK